jgi:hypothetical protein
MIRAFLKSNLLFVCLLACPNYLAEDPHRVNGSQVKEPANAGQNGIVCNLQSVIKNYRIGDHPELTVRIHNQGNHEVFLPGSLDGSERKLRYPHAYFTVSGPKDGLIEQKFGYCGVLNPLRVQDFVRVNSGESFDPYRTLDRNGFWPSTMLLPSRFARAGTYRFEFHYSTESDQLKNWMGSTSSIAKDIKELWQRVPRLRISCASMVNVVN